MIGKKTVYKINSTSIGPLIAELHKGLNVLVMQYIDHIEYNQRWKPIMREDFKKATFWAQYSFGSQLIGKLKFHPTKPKLIVYGGGEAQQLADLLREKGFKYDVENQSKQRKG